MTTTPTRQTLRALPGVTGSLSLVCCLFSTIAQAQISDSLDSFPPRWSLASSDCSAEVVEHANKPNGGVGDSGCESISLNCGHGSEAIIEYRIEPARVIDDLTALAFVKASKPGQRIGLRIRFPYLHNPRNRESVSVVVFGSEYRNAGQWQKIGVGAISDQVRLKSIAVRREYGSTANLDDPFISAVVINTYTGAGATQLSIDNVSIDGLVAVTSTASLFNRSQSAGRISVEDRGISKLSADVLVALPSDRVTRILQHNGERLDWLKTLNFDAILINQPPSERILREAMIARIKIFAPPPSSPDLALESLLEPLVGYYLGTSMNEASVASAQATAERIRKFPARWQRPILIAPAESWRAYAGMSDAMVHDLAPSIRGLAADEEIGSLADRHARMGRSMPEVIGIQSDPPAALIKQLDSISGSIGAPRGDDVPWQAMQLQVARALQTAPRAILYRSNRSLTSGLSEDQRRSMGLSYLNHYLETVGQIVSGSTLSDSLVCEGARYRCGRLEFPGGHLVMASSFAQQRSLVLAGDGDTLQISLPQSDAIKLAWRITHFAAERISVMTTPQGPKLEIISPDTVETIIMSSDPEMGGRIAGALKRVASQAAMDRWQLTHEAIEQLANDWHGATSSHVIVPDRESIDLLNAAKKTLADADPIFRSGDWSSAIRMAARADAWQLKSRWNLHAQLSPNNQLTPISNIPPLLSQGGIPIQIMWWPLMGDRGWGVNRMAGGSLDHAMMIGPVGWSFGRRNESATVADVQIENSHQVEGAGCLFAHVASASNDPLPGGYAGTTMQIRSPGVRFAAGVPVRIDAKIRTLGFGGPDQGVLVFDTISGAELGILVRATPTWQSVRLYRQTISEGEVKVLFDAIGAGELMIDDVQIRSWEPASSQTLPMRRIAEVPSDNGGLGER